MNTKPYKINTDRCKGDGFCAEICPKGIFEIADKKAKIIDQNVSGCIKCGQCIAACPSDAIQIPDLPGELFSMLREWSFSYEDFFAFLSSRRSIRSFKDKPVDRERINKVIEAASTAPMGWPPHSTEILVIDDREELNNLLKYTVENYRKIIWAASNFFFRYLIRFKVGVELFNVLKKYVLPVAVEANETFEKDGTDKYLYNAPVLMLFHANRSAPSYEENAHIVCTYSMLAAHSLGLGSTIIGMIPPVVDQSKDLRLRYSIPAENKVITSLILGYPRYKYRKSIKRDFPSVRYF